MLLHQSCNLDRNGKVNRRRRLKNFLITSGLQVRLSQVFDFLIKDIAFEFSMMAPYTGLSQAPLKSILRRPNTPGLRKENMLSPRKTALQQSTELEFDSDAEIDESVFITKKWQVSLHCIKFHGFTIGSTGINCTSLHISFLLLFTLAVK